MDYRDTRLYGKSLEIYGQCFQLAKQFPPGFADLKDQLRRASSSITLNFSEGCRKQSAKERARYFDIAAGSAREVSAILDIAFLSEAVTAAERDVGQDRCDHFCAMLYKFR